MSTYYYINGKKVRVSDHEPNYSMNCVRGSNDIELYTHDVAGKKLDVQAQITRLFDKGVLDEDDIIEMYNKNLAKRSTLEELDIKAPISLSVLASEKRVIDQWFSDIEGNKELIEEVRANPERYVSFKLNKRQANSWINYFNKKYQKFIK